MTALDWYCWRQFSRILWLQLFCTLKCWTNLLWHGVMSVRLRPVNSKQSTWSWTVAEVGDRSRAQNEKLEASAQPQLSPRPPRHPHSIIRASLVWWIWVTQHTGRTTRVRRLGTLTKYLCRTNGHSIFRKVTREKSSVCCPRVLAINK